MPKPSGCEGCPLYDAPGPIWGSGPSTADICFVGEAPGADEIESGQPFTGGAGRVLTALCASSSIYRPATRIENVVRCRLPNSTIDDYPFAEEVITRCSSLHLHSQLRAMAPKVIVPLGQSANWGLTERGKYNAGIHRYRGYPYQTPLYPSLILPTVHPAALMRERGMFRVVVTDLKKVKRYVSEGYKHPPEAFIIPTRPEEVEINVDVLMRMGQPVVVDIENPGAQLVCIGFGIKNGFSMCVPLIDENWERYWKHPDDEARVIAAIQRLLAAEDVDKVVQFEQHERFYLGQYGFKLGGFWWDLHVMHSMLYPSFPHDLGFIASVHTDRREWKSMVPDWTEEIEEVDK